jgi:hypothetical protein
VDSVRVVRIEGPETLRGRNETAQSKRRKPLSPSRQRNSALFQVERTPPKLIAQFAADSSSNTLTRQRENIAGVRVG